MLETVINELTTVRDMLRWAYSQFNAADLFFGHGIRSAWDEAVYLVSHALHLPPNSNTHILDAKLLKSERKQVAELINQRIIERKPAAYLTKEAWFAGLKFYVDERVIIPRSPIAELIEKHFTPWVEPDQIHKILDLCTGSGCIAIACAHAFPDAVVDASDISECALEVARINIEKHQVDEQVRLIKSDVFKNIKPQSYDIIVSNPPYVDQQDMQSLPEEYRHEPELALAAGKDGLYIVDKILKEAAKYLSENGILIVEVGNSAEALAHKYPEIPFMWLEFERGGEGVFLLTAEQLRELG